MNFLPQVPKSEEKHVSYYYYYYPLSVTEATWRIRSSFSSAEWIWPNYTAAASQKTLSNGFGCITLGSCKRGRDRRQKSKAPRAVTGQGVREILCCTVLWIVAFLLCPCKVPACFLWDVTSLHTERFFFISLGSWIPGDCVLKYIYWQPIT